MAWNVNAAAGLQRYAVNAGEFVTVVEGFVMVCDCAVFRVDGLLRLNGAVRV